MKSRRRDTKSESEDRIKDANHKLRAENRQLKKKVSQLQKEISRLNACQVLDDWDEEEPLLPPKQEPKEEPQDNCPKCKAELNVIRAGLLSSEIAPNVILKVLKKIDKTYFTK